jgi:hypothetical protein
MQRAASESEEKVEEMKKAVEELQQLLKQANDG